MLQNASTGDSIEIENEISAQSFSEIKKKVLDCRVDDSLLEYVFELLNFSRNSSELNSLSNRCGQDIVRLSKAFATVNSRDYVKPSDIQYVFPFVAGHRLLINSHSTEREIEKAKNILDSVPLR